MRRGENLCTNKPGSLRCSGRSTSRRGSDRRALVSVMKRWVVCGGSQMAGGIAGSVPEATASQVDCEGAGGGRREVFGQDTEHGQHAGAHAR